MALSGTAACELLAQCAMPEDQVWIKGRCNEALNEFSARKNNYKKQVLLPEFFFWGGGGVLVLKWEYNTQSSIVNEVKNKMKKRLTPRAVGETVTIEILIGMKLMVRRAPLFPLIWPLQWEINTDKDLKYIWYSVSHQLHIDNLVKIRETWNGASVLLHSASRPGWFPQMEELWVGHTPHADSPKSGHQHKGEHQCSSTLKVPPLCNSSLLFGNQEHLLNRVSLPVFHSQNTLHGNQIQQFMQLLTFSIGQHEVTKKKGKPQASFDCWAHHLSTTFGTHV